MDYTNPHALVDTAWLSANLGYPEVRVVDATFFLPTVARDANSEFEQCHIPGAGFLDIDAIADRDTDLPHILPEPTTPRPEAGRLGTTHANHHKIHEGHGGSEARARR